MRLKPGQRWFTQKERLSLSPNQGEVLMGYQWVAPFDDCVNRLGLTREENAMIMYHLDSLQKHRYLQALSRKGNKPVQPAILVPVYVCLKNTGCYPDFNEWIVRTFKAEFTEIYEKKHWWSDPRLVLKDHLRLCPDISCYIEPEDSKLESVLKHWENLDKKSVLLAELRELIGLSPETKTA